MARIVLLATSILSLGIVTAKAGADIWGPWRPPAAPAATIARFYQAEKESAVVFLPWEKDGSALDVAGLTVRGGEDGGHISVSASYADGNQAPGNSVNFAGLPLTDEAGVEVSFAFRVARIPGVGVLDASHSLAYFGLANSAGTIPPRAFWLHAYATRGSGFMLNGLAYNARPPWPTIHLMRQAMTPGEAPPFDTNWHTVRIAWNQTTMVVSWDGLPIFHAEDANVAFDTFSIHWVKPGGHFRKVHLAPFEIRQATFRK